MKTWIKLAPFASLSLLATASCLEPTQIELGLRTDVPWQQGRSVAIAVGAPGTTESAEPSTVYDQTWDGNDIGTLVLLPKNERDEPISVRVVMSLSGRDPSTCSIAAPEGCIFARRKLAFVPHEPLKLPVMLYSACEGVPCEENSTCDALGRCVPADVDPRQCADGKVCEPDGGELVVAPDATGETSSSSGGGMSSSSGDGGGMSSSSGGGSSSSGGVDGGSSSGGSSSGGSNGRPPFPGCPQTVVSVNGGSLFNWGDTFNDGGSINVNGTLATLITNTDANVISFTRRSVGQEVSDCALTFEVEFQSLVADNGAVLLMSMEGGGQAYRLEDRGGSLQFSTSQNPNPQNLGGWSRSGWLKFIFPLNSERLYVEHDERLSVVDNVPRNPQKLDLVFGLAKNPAKAEIRSASFYYSPAPE